MVYAQIRICIENGTLKILSAFEIQMAHLIPVQKSRFRMNKQEEKNLSSIRFYSSSGLSSEDKRKRKDKQILRSCWRT